ncbi:LysR family transcriptional regulator [Verticiella sediminum]|uniref:LysR family transcriptional regulator n=1 Tax=Verticiella sediminum TaxID=1247510 RepID=A0A556AIL2_9BURK|nr:LysR family transcriptional regulator [Verticiella sediminum]TSH92717.1 LysR family transcriptional regulator [Verticiella sediminum]
MNLSLRDLDYFLTVVACGQISKAAEQCGVSQPALSKSLRRLETETGLTLLDRGRHGVFLTSAGLVFVEHARKLRAEYGDAVRNTHEMRMGQAGLLRLGATRATMDEFVLPTLARLLPRRPAMRVQLRYGLSDDLRVRVDAGELDLAVMPVYGEAASETDACIHSETLCVAASERHPLALQRRVSARELLDFPWIMPMQGSDARRALEHSLAASGVAAPPASLEVESYSEGTLRLLAESQMIALVPEAVVGKGGRQRLARLPVRLASPLRRSMLLVSRAGATWSPLMRAFREAMPSKVQRRPD